MKLGKKLLIVVVALVAVVAITGTGLFFYKRPPAPVTLTEEEVEAYTAEWTEKLSTVELQQNGFSSRPDGPLDAPEPFREVYRLGYGASFFLADQYIQREYRHPSWVLAAFTNLNMTSPYGPWEAETPQYDVATDVHGERLKRLLEDVPGQVEAICNDRTLTLSEKTEWLAEYGMLAVPLLQDRMRRGEFWWEETVLLLTMAPLSAEERFQLLLDSYSSEIQTSPARNRLILERRREMLAGKKLPKNWFVENAEELALLRHWYN